MIKNFDNDLITKPENEFLKEKRSDILVIATQDRDHVRQAIKALDLGYDILLEKPISPDKQELLDLLEAQKRTGKTVMVCHVLRYAPAFTKLKELLAQRAKNQDAAADAKEEGNQERPHLDITL